MFGEFSLVVMLWKMKEVRVWPGPTSMVDTVWVTLLKRPEQLSARAADAVLSFLKAGSSELS